MHYEVLRLYKNGVRLEQKVLDRSKRITADVHIQIDKFGPLGRESMCASIFGTPRSTFDHSEHPTYPSLYDIRMTGMATLAFTIEGVEFVGGRMYQQEWHCKELREAVQIIVPWTACPRSSLDELI